VLEARLGGKPVEEVELGFASELERAFVGITGILVAILGEEVGKS
jgi:hypothetical protein